MEEAPKDRRGSDLGAQLRSLGYLQDPMTRFLSGGLEDGAAGKRSSLLHSYLVVGAKVGIVLGLVLFALLSVGFALVGRFILLDLRDHLLFHLYLLLFALPCGFLAGLGLAGIFALYSALRRRAWTKVTLAARKCSWTIAAAILVYFLLLWMRLRESLPRGGLLADLAAASVCVLVALFIGRLVFAAALYLGSRRRSYDPLEQAPRRSGLLSLVALLLLTVVAFACLRVLGRDADMELREAAPFQVEPGRRVLWIGVDGLDLEAVRELAAEGRLATFARLMTEGRTLRLDSGGALHPLSFWANASTGMPPARHGVSAPTLTQPRGLSGALFVDRSMVGFFEIVEVILPLLRLSRESPLSAALMREKALAEILAGGGCKGATINWWLTHPIDPQAPGVGVSERAIWLAWNRLEHGESRVLPEEVSPKGFQAAFLATIHPPEEMRSEPGACPPEAPVAEAEYKARALDECAVALALELLERGDLGCIQVGLWGANALLDALQGASSGALSDHREVVRRMTAFYGSLDLRLGRLLAACEREGILICLSAASEARGGAKGEKLRDGGFAIFHGPGIVHDHPSPQTAAKASPLDLLPTLLVAMGFPVSEEMPGRPLLELWGDPPPLRRVSSFGPPAPRSVPSAEDDREALRMFRALGYL